jgi:hypothetical protein
MLRILLATLIVVIPGFSRTTQPATMPLTGGGEVTISKGSEFFEVAVKGPAAGLASLCLADDKTVRILHASAAVGEATYERDGDRWVLRTNFEWKLRDSRQAGPPTEAQSQAFLESAGWTANPSNRGDVSRNFRIRLSDRTRFLGVTFLTTSEPMAVSHWPDAMDDDCRAVKIAQGYLPATARFRPETWHRIN